MDNVKLVTLTRGLYNRKLTLGMIKIKGPDHLPIYTLENPWLNNQEDISCIPEDSYVCEYYFSSKFRRGGFRITGVLDRSDIVFHQGNRVRDTEGCILPGLSLGSYQEEPAVLYSKKAMDYLQSLLGNNPFILTIK